MFATETREIIENAINAVKNYGEKYNSLHEGYAVLKEEVEETEKEFQKLNLLFSIFWEECVKCRGDLSKMHAGKIKNIAISLILEVCQVAAICEKIKGV